MRKIIFSLFIVSILLLSALPFSMGGGGGDYDTNTDPECRGYVCKRINHGGGSVRISYGGDDYDITNGHSSNDYFIPFKSMNEFNSFKSHPPAGVSVSEVPSGGESPEPSCPDPTSECDEYMCHVCTYVYENGACRAYCDWWPA